MDEQDAFNQQAGLIMARSSYANANNNEINTLLSELTDPEKDIYEVELSLKGIEIGSKGEKIKVNEPLLNDLGVANMIRLLRSMTSRIMYMSNLEDDQIRIMTISLGDAIVKDLVFHKVEYEIKSDTAMSTIINIILYKAFESGMAALENGFRRFLKSGIVETTINTQGNQIKGGKGGGISSILGLTKK